MSSTTSTMTSCCSSLSTNGDEQAIGEWEETNAEPFVYLGRPYTEIMEEQRVEEVRLAALTPRI